MLYPFIYLTFFNSRKDIIHCRGDSMNDSSSYLKKLEDFLGGTFHQDIDSPEEVLDEYIHLSYKKPPMNHQSYSHASFNKQIPLSICSRERFAKPSSMCGCTGGFPINK